MDKEGLQEFGSTRRKGAHATFIWPLHSNVTIRCYGSYFCHLSSLPSSSFHLCLPIHVSVLFLCWNQNPALFFSSDVSCPVLSLAYCLSSHHLCRCPSPHSSFPLHTPTSPFSSVSSGVHHLQQQCSFSQLILDLTSPMSASLTSLLAQQVRLLHPGSQSLILCFSKLFIPAFLHTSFLQLSTYLLAGKPIRPGQEYLWVFSKGCTVKVQSCTTVGPCSVMKVFADKGAMSVIFQRVKTWPGILYSDKRAFLRQRMRFQISIFSLVPWKC